MIKSFHSLKKNGIIKTLMKRNEPIDPEIVLLGLILVSFFPLKNLPKARPSYISRVLKLKKQYNKYTS